MKAVLRWVLALYVVFLGSEEYFAGPGHVYKIAVALFLLFLLSLVSGNVKIRFSSVGVFLVLYAVIGVVSVLWSVDPQRTSTYALVLVQLLITTWISATCIEDESDMRRMVWCLALASLFPGVAMAHDFMVGRHAWTLGYLNTAMKEYGARMTFGDADPNFLAYRFAVSTVAATYLVLNTRRAWVKAILFAMVALFIATSLLTGSRGGAIALVLSMVVLLLTDLRKKIRALMILAGVAALLVVAVPFLPSKVSNRYLGLGEEVAHGSMAGRKDIYKDAAESFERHPLLGVGYLAFESATRQHGGKGRAAHNDPLQVVVDIGLVGLGIYLSLMATLFWRAMKTPAPWKSLALGLLAAYWVSSLSLTLLLAKLPWVTFAVILGVGASKQASRLRLPGWSPWFSKSPDLHA